MQEALSHARAHQHVAWGGPTPSPSGLSPRKKTRVGGSLVGSTKVRSGRGDMVADAVGKGAGTLSARSRREQDASEADDLVAQPGLETIVSRCVGGFVRADERCVRSTAGIRRDRDVESVARGPTSDAAKDLGSRRHRSARALTLT